jgi:hypothetical protein
VGDEELTIQVVEAVYDAHELEIKVFSDLAIKVLPSWERAYRHKVEINLS